MQRPTPAIRLRNLTLGYDRRPAVHHLGGNFATGSLTAVIGPNGAGKSTLLKGIAGALPPLGGRIEFPERAAMSGKGIAYLPQSVEIDCSFPISVFDLVAMGLWQRTGLFGGLGRGDRQQVTEAIAAVGLAGFERRSIGALSGGQLQRALFARLSLQDAAILLLDEPFTAIDTHTTSDLIEIVCRWHGEGRTIIAVLHDYEIVRQAFPQCLLIAREEVAWGVTDEVLTPDNLLAARRILEMPVTHPHFCERPAA